MGNADNLAAGDRFGQWVVVENRADLLRLGRPQGVPRFLIGAGLVGLIGGLALMVSAAAHGARGLVVENWGAASGGLILVGIAMTIVGAQELGLSYEFDGNSRTVTKRRVVVIRRWAADAFEMVNVAVTHHGPDEILRLTLVARGPGASVVIAEAPSDARGLALVQAAAQIARILKLPATRYGKSRQEDSSCQSTTR